MNSYFVVNVGVHVRVAVQLGLMVKVRVKERPTVKIIQVFGGFIT